MRMKRTFWITFLLFTSILISMAQERQINGVVTSATDGGPIIGATVVIKGKQTGTVTDENGRFQLSVQPKDVLRVTYIGYIAQEVEANKQSLSVQLAEDVSLLDDVVVVGYGQMRKADLTGAVVQADIKAFEKAPNANLLQSLQGAVPGLNVGQVTSAGGSPSLQIRGKNTISGNSNVLVVLDGIIFTGDISAINPADIASVDVLKDASSTAVYGAQAANGVLLITSRKGTQGKAKISYTSSFTAQNPTRKLKTMNRAEILDWSTDCLWSKAYTAASGYTEADPNFNLVSRLPDTFMFDETGNIVDTDYDWFGAFTRTGKIYENKLNISGGNQDVSYMLSFGNTTQQNYLLNDDFRRNSIRINVDAQVRSWWKAGVQAFGAFVNTDGQETYLPYLVSMSPLASPTDKDGKDIPFPMYSARENPYHGSEVNDYDRQNTFFANIYSEFNLPVKGLTYRVNFGNNYRVTQHYYASEYTNNLNGGAYKNHSQYYDYTFDNIVNYARTFGRHDFGATLLYGASRRKYDYTNAESNIFPRMTLGYHSLELGKEQYTRSDAWLETMLYQMARINYKYADRYLLTATVRRDGFSGFSANNKSAVFPSVALGWIISEEEWMKVPAIDYLKLRAGYGVSGNQANRYSSLARVDSEIGYIFGDGVSGSLRQELAAIENADLKWEKTHGLNLGVDFALLGNRLTGSMEFYHTTTKDLLYNVAIPSMTGFTSIASNVGEIANRGFELNLTSHNIRTRDFSWETTLSLSTNKNEIIKLTGMDTDGDGKEDDLKASSLFIGESLSAIYDYEIDGIYQIGDDIPEGFYPGSYRIVDQTGEGEITADDRKIIGRADPALRLGLMNKMSYKNFSLSFFFNSVLGGSKSYRGLNTNAVQEDDNAIRYNRFKEEADLFWSPRNPGGIYARPVTGAKITPNRYESRNFLRLQDITFGYDLPLTLVQKLKIEGVNVYLNAKNLATITGWHGWDPEPDTSYNDTNGQTRYTGSRYENRPVMRSFTVGLNIQF